MLVGLTLLAIAAGLALQQQKYQAGQCTITAKQLQHEISTTTTNNSNGSRITTSTDVYAPYFEYVVHTADNRSYTSSGYDGSDTYTSDHAGQQAIVDSYLVEKSYQCWYDPANPTHAVLVRRPNWLLILLGGGFFLLGALFLIIGVFLLISQAGSAGRSWRYSWRG